MLFLTEVNSDFDFAAVVHYAQSLMIARAFTILGSSTTSCIKESCLSI
jgi:hypothetical protein